MAGLNPKVWIASAVVMVGVVALAPQSRWTIQNHLDILGGNWKRAGYGDVIEPRHLMSLEGSQGSDFEARMVKAFATTRHDVLFPFAEERPDDVLIQAHALRLGTVAARVPSPKAQVHAAANQALLRDARERAVRIAQCGERLEPDNGFFPAMKAVALWAQGKKAEAEAALVRASQAKTFNDHVLDEADMRERVMARHYGYRGEMVRMFSLASVLLPHYAVLSTLGEAIQREGSPEARQAMLGVARRMGEDTDTLIGILVAVKLGRLALNFEGANTKPLGPWTRQEALDAARKLDALLQKNGRDPGDSVRLDAVRLVQLRDASHRDEGSVMPLEFGIGMLYVSGLLAALLVGLPAALIVLPLIRRVPHAVRSALPHVAAGAAWVLVLTFASMDEVDLWGFTHVALVHFVLAFLYARRWIAVIVSAIAVALSLGLGYDALLNDRYPDLAAALGLLAMLALVFRADEDRRERLAARAGLLVAAAGLAAALVAPMAAVPAVVFVVGYLVSRKEASADRERPWITAISVVLVALFCGTFFVMNVLNAHDPLMLAAVSVLFSGLLLATIFQKFRPHLPALGVSAFVLTLIYVCGVGFELIQNNALGAMNRGFLKEADEARAKAGPPAL